MRYVTLLTAYLSDDSSPTSLAAPHILVLDCATQDDPSEGRLLREFFDICKLYKPARGQALCYPVRSKREFLSKLNRPKRYDIIHISAHGSSDGRGDAAIGNGSTWWASSDEIAQTKHHAKLIFVNACVSSKKKVADAFHSKYFLAPKSNVRWDDAAMFSLMFYKRYLVDGISMNSAFRFAKKHTKAGTH